MLAIQMQSLRIKQISSTFSPNSRENELLLALKRAFRAVVLIWKPANLTIVSDCKPPPGGLVGTLSTVFQSTRLRGTKEESRAAASLSRCTVTIPSGRARQKTSSTQTEVEDVSSTNEASADFDETDKPLPRALRERFVVIATRCSL